MVSLERLLQYANLPPEEPPTEAAAAAAGGGALTTRAAPPAGWPRGGAIKFEGCAMGYLPHLPDALKGVSFEVAAGEKVGVCGRTGSGKTTLMYTLFRLVELRRGRITVDGVDIRSLKLETLRSRLSIIPQDPVLFTDSLRYNVDPKGEHSDGALVAMLRECGLGEYVGEHADGLERPIETGGANMSAGQRQLLCMARALLKEARVLLLDEATANLDAAADALLQQTLAQSAAVGAATVLTIAHRLDTIMASDKVLVMDAGRVAEYDAPEVLKARPGSIFGGLCAAAEHH